MLSSIVLLYDGDLAKEREAKRESEKIVRWLTNRCHQSIMEKRSFTISTDSPPIANLAFWWENSAEEQKERLELQHCTMEKATENPDPDGEQDSEQDSKAKKPKTMSYSAMYRTMTPGATLEVYVDLGKPAKYRKVGNIVIPVRGFPRLDWVKK